MLYCSHVVLSFHIHLDHYGSQSHKIMSIQAHSGGLKCNE